MALSWPTTAGSFQVEGTGSLISPVVWTVLPLTPTIVDGVATLELSITDAFAFYRLIGQ